MREAAIRLPLEKKKKKKKKETTNFSPLSVHTNEIRSNFRFLFNLHPHKVTRLYVYFLSCFSPEFEFLPFRK